ncbi:pentapeptide repeat-containing protein [Micromonospora sagamiensis]|uniref:Pentapeptide repeat protein n=1 Tax=Micromonospora sagamiensis TaxID=47875 RepID=A0A562WPV0_9ACTN|nr:pentapeptide repeat-containing protein [Micromonospora sagamiensis]TWJ32245.1 pentapeptide repeat protein [Micromonospora sagamiensis]BCL14696.1 hypothetical protein GCM10017556_24350 [Micromonospora sagamiensis]
MELVPAGPIDVKPDPWQRLVAIGSILSVLFVAIGLYVTNEANREQQRLTAQGQITDRFTKAVEQLGQPGPEKVDVRLGAIYALERIMRDSAEDQPAVVNILAAFVRVHAPAPERLFPDPPIERLEGTRLRAPVDIQAALTVLVHRDTSPNGGHSARPRRALDLANTDLTGAILIGADLAHADLTGTVLVDADLFGANLTGADLDYSNLDGANLASADLTRADLHYTNLDGADLAGANLAGANLDSAHLGRADLRCARTDGDTRLPRKVARPTACN